MDSLNLLNRQQGSQHQHQIRFITFVPAVKAGGRLVHAEDPSFLLPLNQPFTQTRADSMPGPLVQGQAPRTSRQVAVSQKNKRELFKEEDVQLHWSNVSRAGAGLQNLGNTCFMNSVLQCLAHTPPLAEAVLSGCAQCPPSSSANDDPLAITLAHIRRVFSSHSIVRPGNQVKVLRTINRRFRPGRQEDSHEYLRCLLDALHEACLKPFKPKPPPQLAATTFINRIFGARLRSRIKCHGVDYESSTYETFMDLSLEINRASNINRALQHFTAKETLDGDNKYRCPKNNKLVRAEKQMTIEEAPNVLTIHLKRFQFGGVGSKITKLVEYDKEINLQPYMSKPECGPQWYDLYGVLVHLGHSVHSGHYYCFVRAGNGMWHKCDDTSVGQCSERTALGQQAYILFYVRRHPRSLSAARQGSASLHAGATAECPATSPASQKDAAAANGSHQQQLPNGPVAEGKAMANGMPAKVAAASNALPNGLLAKGVKHEAVGQVAVDEDEAPSTSGRGTVASKRGHPDVTAVAGTVRPSVDGGVLLPPSKKLRSKGGVDDEDGEVLGASGRGAAASKRGLLDVDAAAGNDHLGLNVNGGVLLPPGKKARGKGVGADGELRGSRVAEGLQQSSSSVAHSLMAQDVQGAGTGGEASSPHSTLLSPHAPSSGRPGSQQRAQVFARMATQLARFYPNSTLTMHLNMHKGHMSQRHTRELCARSRTEIKQLAHQEQEQQGWQREVQGEVKEQEGPVLQNGRQGSHQHASTRVSADGPSSPQPLSSLAQRQHTGSRKQVQEQHLLQQPQQGEGGGKQQQQQQQQGNGERVLVGADAARFLGSNHAGLCARSSRGKPAGLQPWADVDPSVAKQQADMLMGSHQPTRSRQLDAWDQEYDAGKTKKVRDKDRIVSHLHSNGNAFQAFQQQKQGSGSKSSKNRGRDSNWGFGGGRGNGRGRGRGGGRGRGRGGGRF